VGVVQFVRAGLTRGRDARRAFTAIRLSLGRFLALGLEFQLAGDVLRTAIAPSFAFGGAPSSRSIADGDRNGDVGILRSRNRHLARSRVSAIRAGTTRIVSVGRSAREAGENAMKVLEQRSLTDVTGGDGGAAAAGDLGYARYDHGYDTDLLDAVHTRSLALRAQAQPVRTRFLALDHLRRVQQLIPEVADLVYDRDRLARLSDLAGTELEPYPIGTSCSGVNFYRPGELPIQFHRDGPAFVELVPLYADGSQDGGSTLLFRGPADVGSARLRALGRLEDEELTGVPQRVGGGVLFQGRMLLHSAETLTDGHRVTLVMSLRSKAEPWKDGNTLSRLLNDDRPDHVLADWLHDVDSRRLPALREFLIS
jgi:hypothetical protein